MLVALAFVLAATAAPVLSLEGERGEITVAGHADALPDPRSDVDIAQAVRRAGDFGSPQKLDLEGSILQPRSYWLRFRPERGASTADWALVIHAEVDHVDLYVPRAGGGFDRRSGGLGLSRGDDAIVHRVMPLPDGAYGKTDYLHVFTSGSTDDVALMPLLAGAQNVLERNTLHVFFMGYFVAIASLYLLLFVILRQRPLVQYSGIMASLTALLYVDSGSVFNYLPSMTFGQRQFLHDAVFYAYFTLLALFTTTFLRLLQRDRFAFALIVVAAAANTFDLLTYFVSLPAWAESIPDYATIAFFVALSVSGARAWRDGMRPAIFYTLAICMVLLGYGLNIVLTDFPTFFEGVPILYLYGFEAAVALEALLLGIAVTERIRETAREYERLVIASRELEDLALRDGLTGTLNRRAFDRGLADVWHTAASRRERVGLLMIDVDHFKRFNDRYGHQAGDECLRRVAGACAGCVRGVNLFARYGGEEFAAIVPNATLDDLEAIGRRMRSAVAHLAILHETASGRVTLSIGGAAKHASDVRSEQGLIAAADAALYRAKEEGRDRVLVDGVPDKISDTESAKA